MFTWRDLRGHAAVPDGRYAVDAVDQHRAAWCGACYIVSAAQMVQDRAHVALAIAGRRSTGPPNLSLQSLMDFFEEWGAGPEWNACHGGFPLHVLSCMERGECPLVVGQPGEWAGFARTTASCPRPDLAHVRVSRPRRVPPRHVRRCLEAGGPVVLEVNAHTLKTTDARGVVSDLAPRLPNHAVCVVGWTRVAGAGDCWIVRNSWGTDRVPVDIPDDHEVCVGRGYNRCTAVFERWNSDPADPGFCFLPARFAPLDNESPSPWIACDVLMT